MHICHENDNVLLTKIGKVWCPVTRAYWSVFLDCNLRYWTFDDDSHGGLLAEYIGSPNRIISTPRVD